MMINNSTLTPANTITREDGEAIAYHKTEGKGPGVVFLTGFKSDMEGGKALILEEMCKQQGRAFLRFDYQGHGESSGDFLDGTIGRWADDAVFALDKLTEGPQVLVGSSMGGWIMLLAALQRKDRIAGLVGTAAAPDFTEDLMWDTFSEAQKKEMAETGRIEIPNCYDDDPYYITQRLIEDGRNNLLLRAPLSLTCPVRLIQGMQDEDVPWQTAHRIVDALVSNDVELTLVKDGDHRLSEDHHLDRLCRIVAKLLDQIENNETP